MGKFSNVAHYQDFTELKKILSASAANTYDMDKIEKAYKFAEKAHGDQRRVSGIPYILHPVSVACIVAELGMDTDSVCGALLHDTVEDTGVTLEEVTKLFGADVAKLIDGVTKISKIPYSTREQQQAENIRKMLIAMADDIRVIIIKLADRLHNMRTMNCMPEQKRRDKSLENMQPQDITINRITDDADAADRITASYEKARYSDKNISKEELEFMLDFIKNDNYNKHT